jgi:hypothetical protein
MNLSERSLDAASLWEASWRVHAAMQEEGSAADPTAAAASAFASPVKGASAGTAGGADGHAAGEADALLASLWWALLRRGEEAAARLRVPDDGLRTLVARLRSPTCAADVRASCCGILGQPQLHGTSRAASSPVRAVAAALRGAMADASLLVAAEALNGCFELFGEDDAWRHALFLEERVGEEMVRLLPLLQTRFRGPDGRALSEAERDRVDEALENLEGFLAYKRSQERR